MHAAESHRFTTHTKCWKYSNLMFLSDQLERILRYADRFACLFHVYEFTQFFYFLSAPYGYIFIVRWRDEAWRANQICWVIKPRPLKPFYLQIISISLSIRNTMRVWITARGVAWYSVFRLQKQFSNEMIGYLPQRKIERVWYNLRIIKYFERNFGKFETHVLIF